MLIQFLFELWYLKLHGIRKTAISIKQSCYLEIGGCPNHLARKPVPLQSEHRIDPWMKIRYGGFNYMLHIACALGNWGMVPKDIEWYWQIIIRYTFPVHMTQLVLFEGTWQSMLSPRTKKPVPAHHLHSICPFELQEEQATGLGCCKW